jgi:hypothetical protein
VSKEIGKFYQIRNNGIKPLGIMKSNAKSTETDIETNLLLLQGNKRVYKGSKKSHGYGGYFPQPSLLLPGLAYNQLAQFKKSKRNVGNGTGLSGRRQRIRNKLQHTTW